MVFRFSQEERQLLSSIDRFSRSKRVRLYAVGGVIRDSFLHRSKLRPDFDFTLRRGSLAFGRKLAAHLKGAFVLLDRQHGACRIVKRLKQTLCTIDLTDFRGASLEEDLQARDYTINALAVDLRDLVCGDCPLSAVVDPLDGYKDIRRGIVRITGESALRDDPLRILRAFSFSAQLGFTITPATRRLLKKYKEKLAGISCERIRDELFKVLESPDAARFVDELDSLKILDIIFPEIARMRGCAPGPYHHLDVWKHSVEALRQLEGALPRLEKDARLKAYLDTRLSADRSRRALLKVGVLFHDVAKPAAFRRQGKKIIFHGHDLMGARMIFDAARRLKLSNTEADALKIMVRSHLRPGYLSDFAKPTPRALYRFFRDTGDEAVSVLLLSLGDQRATRGPLTTPSSHRKHERLFARLLKVYFREKEEVRPLRLLNGDDVMKAFGLSPSVLIGEILEELRELQATGRIRTRRQALVAAAKMVARKKK